MNVRIAVSAVVLMLLVIGAGQPVRAQTSGSSTDKPKEGSSSTTETKPATPPTPPAHVNILKDAKTVSGLWTVYQKGSKLYWEISSADYGSEYIVMIAISRGIARGDLLGGFTWNQMDDWVWQFRKAGENVHVVRKNVRFKANPNSPESKAVAAAYTDSVLFSLPIMTKGPKGGDLVDLTEVFMSDLPQISRVLPGFSFSSQKSIWAEVKGFDDNMELEVAATYASGGTQQIETVPDSRGVTINAVCPGPILTNLRRHSQEILGPDVPDMSGRGIAVSEEQVRAVVPAGRRGTVEDIASAVCYLASDDAGYITGHAMLVDGGWRAK
jgi:hypothetical protein